MLAYHLLAGHLDRVLEEYLADWGLLRHSHHRATTTTHRARSATTGQDQAHARGTGGGEGSFRFARDQVHEREGWPRGNREGWGTRTEPTQTHTPAPTPTVCASVIRPLHFPGKTGYRAECVT